MRVAGITARGEPVEILEVDELARPAAGEVLLDVAAAGIGNWDELVRIGSWQLGGPAPMALGTVRDWERAPGRANQVVGDQRRARALRRTAAARDRRRPWLVSSLRALLEFVVGERRKLLRHDHAPGVEDESHKRRRRRPHGPFRI
jgi:hypothetical protein